MVKKKGHNVNFWVKGCFVFLTLITIGLLLGSCFSSDKGDTKKAQIGQNNIGKAEVPGEALDDDKDKGGEIKSQDYSSKPEMSIHIDNFKLQSNLTPQTTVHNGETEGVNTSPLPSEPLELKGDEPIEEGADSKGVKEDEESRELLSGERQDDLIHSDNSSNLDFSRIKVGMTYEEVVGILGEPNMLVSSRKENNTFIYLWRQSNTSLYGKFENGVLVRRSGRLDEEIETIPLTEEAYMEVKIGMTLEEVNNILKREGRKISGEGIGEGIYLWSDTKLGTSFSAKFEDGKLVRKSSFYSKPRSLSEISDLESGETLVTNEGVPSKEEVVQTEQEEKIEDGERIKEEELVKKDLQISDIDQEERTKKDIRISPQRVVSVGKKKVGVEQKSEVGESERGEMRKVRLPDFTYQLREGSYEMKIHNPLDVEVIVGVRSDKRGKNLSIGPGGTKSIKVPRGEYEIFYIRSDEPTRLLEGGTVKIDGLFVGDVDIYLIK